MGGFGSGRKSKNAVALTSAHEQRAERLEANLKRLERFLHGADPEDDQKRTRMERVFQAVYQSAIGRGPGCPPAWKAGMELLKYVVAQPVQAIDVNQTINRNQNIAIDLSGLTDEEVHNLNMAVERAYIDAGIPIETGLKPSSMPAEAERNRLLGTSQLPPPMNPFVEEASKKIDWMD